MAVASRSSKSRKADALPTPEDFCQTPIFSSASGRGTIIQTFGIDVNDFCRITQASLMAATFHAIRLMQDGDGMHPKRYTALEAWGSASQVLGQNLPKRIGGIYVEDLGNEGMTQAIYALYWALHGQTHDGPTIPEFSVDVKEFCRVTQASLMAATFHAIRLMQDGDGISTYTYTSVEAWGCAYQVTGHELPTTIGDIHLESLGDEAMTKVIYSLYWALHGLICAPLTFQGK